MFSVFSLLCRGTWLLELNWACDRHFFWGGRHRRGTPCYDLLQNRRERSCCPSRYSLRLTIIVWVKVVDSPQSYDGLPRGRWSTVKTCHARWKILYFKSNSSRGRVFAWVLPVPGTSVSYVGHSYPCPELLEVLYASAANIRGTGTGFSYLPGTCVSSVRPCHNTRNIQKFWKAFVPVPGTSGSYVRLSYQYPKTMPQNPGCGYGMFCTRPELLKVLYARSTIPGTSVTYVTLPYPYPKFLEVL